MSCGDESVSAYTVVLWAWSGLGGGCHRCTGVSCVGMMGGWMMAVWQVPVHSLQVSWNSVQMGCGDESVSAYGVARTGWYGMC
jgi:hypothetical protein